MTSFARPRATLVTRRSTLLALTALALPGCNAKKDTLAAEKAVTKFHAQFNKEQFATMYAETHEEFKKASSEEDIIELFQAVHSKLGPVVSTEQKVRHVTNINFVRYVKFNYETTFKEGTGTETFRFIIEDTKAKLLGYNINSRDMLVK
ncbi:MAG: DUF4019 domain-containing protein [Myxococcales bacterium]|nr:DUF4019 domain-containing protein [Myxococcales bacterium]